MCLNLWIILLPLSLDICWKMYSLPKNYSSSSSQILQHLSCQDFFWTGLGVWLSGGHTTDVPGLWIGQEGEPQHLFRQAMDSSAKQPYPLLLPEKALQPPRQLVSNRGHHTEEVPQWGCVGFRVVEESFGSLGKMFKSTSRPEGEAIVPWSLELLPHKVMEMLALTLMETWLYPGLQGDTETWFFADWWFVVQLMSLQCECKYYCSHLRVFCSYPETFSEWKTWMSLSSHVQPACKPCSLSRMTSLTASFRLTYPTRTHFPGSPPPISVSHLCRLALQRSIKPTADRWLSNSVIWPLCISFSLFISIPSL